MELYSRRVIMLIPAADQERANVDACQWDHEGGEETFRVGLSADGEEPPSHYWCSVQMRETTFQAVSAHVATHYPAGQVYEGAAADPAAVLAALNLQPVRLPGGPEEQ